MSIDFREKNIFSRKIKHEIMAIRKKMNQLDYGVLADINSLLKIFKEEYPSSDEINPCDVYSQFLQNLVYYICHNVEDKEYVEKIVSNLLENPFFYFINKHGDVTLWIDPKHKFTACNVLCLNRYDTLLSKLLTLTETIELDRAARFPDMQISFFKLVISLPEKKGNTPLHMAVKNSLSNITKSPDDPSILLILLIAAEKAYGTYTSSEFIKFFSALDDEQNSPLMLACLYKISTLTTLFKTAETAFGNLRDLRFQRMILQRNSHGKSLLNFATLSGDISHLLQVIIIAKKALGKSSPELRGLFDDVFEQEQETLVNKPEIKKLLETHIPPSYPLDGVLNADPSIFQTVHIFFVDQGTRKRRPCNQDVQDEQDVQEVKRTRYA